VVLLPDTLMTESTPEEEGALAPANVTLVTAPPGVGKTHAAIESLARHRTRAVFVAPTHDLAQQVQLDLQSRSVTTHYWRQGPNEEDECIKQDEVEFFRGLGYVIRFGPCMDCEKRKQCTYRKLFTSRANESAQVLIITSWHLRRDDLWDLKALRDRPLVILDEDALSAIAAPVELTVDRLQRFIENLSKLQDALAGRDRDDDDDDHHLVDTDDAIAMTVIFQALAEQILRACATAGHGQWQPSSNIVGPVVTEAGALIIGDDDVFRTVVRSAYEVVRKQTSLPNMLADLRDLVIEPRPVHLSVGACRWTRRAIIPGDRHVLMLDATAEPVVVEGVLGRSVEVIDTPPVEQRATVYQIMDKIGTRAGNRRDLASEESWTVKLATEVARRHRGQPLLCVTFKHDEEQMAELLEREHGGATVIHYGALRGLNTFENFDAGLIIGRPMPNEAQLQLLAVAAFGPDALDVNLRGPPLEWKLHTHQVGPDTWTVRCQQYDDPRWQTVWRHVVTGELMQAIGRLRPLTNDATVYVVSNEPLPDWLDVTAVYASELFDAMGTSTRRSDFRQRVEQYAEVMESLELAGIEPTNRAVCAKLGIKECNGFRYRKLAQQSARPP